MSDCVIPMHGPSCRCARGLSDADTVELAEWLADYLEAAGNEIQDERVARVARAVADGARDLAETAAALNCASHE